MVITALSNPLINNINTSPSSDGGAFKCKTTMIKRFYTVFQTNIGWIGLAGSLSGLRRVTLPEKSYEDARQALGLAEKLAETDSDYFSGLINSFKDYYLGLPVNFRVRIDFSGLTGFQIAVYQSAMTIPYGETRSYGWIAGKTSNPQAARAVGQALGRNPFPIIVPCHRVIAADGKLGGFGGGLPLKQYLLELEAKNDTRSVKRSGYL
jgi:methylated-DNA-[protein]-cysteine S-methyltransferase